MMAWSPERNPRNQILADVGSAKPVPAKAGIRNDEVWLAGGAR